MLKYLHILHVCWRIREVLQDMKDAIMTFIKVKKIGVIATTTEDSLSLVLLVRHLDGSFSITLQVLAECVYPESQCSFCVGRSAIDIVFTLRQLQEKS